MADANAGVSSHSMRHARCAPVHRGMRHLRALVALALGCAVAASAEPSDADEDVFDDALAPSSFGSPEAPSYLDDPNAWVDRLRRSAEDIAAARPLVNDAYRGFFQDLAHARPENAKPWPGLFRGGASADGESAPPDFRFRTEEAEGAERASLAGRLAAPAAAGDAVLGALEVSEDIIARTAPDALDATSDVVRVIQEQTELAQAALAGAETRDDDGDATDDDYAAPNAESAFEGKSAPFRDPSPVLRASFAVDPRGPFAAFPASGPGSFPDAATIASIADPGSYGAGQNDDGGPFPFGSPRVPKGFGGVARVVASRAADAAARLYSAAFDENARAEHSVAAKRALARLVDLTLEGQANAPVGQYFADPNAADRAKTFMDRVKANAARRAFGTETEDAEDAASPYDASFARGIDLAASLREDDAEREARVRAELDLAGVIERQGGEGT